MVLICVALQLYAYVIIARMIMSWFPPTPGTTYQQIFDAVTSVTEPVIGPVRAVLPPFRMGAMGLDLSPMVVILGILLIIRIVC
jgi:YggT family protein